MLRKRIWFQPKCVSERSSVRVGPTRSLGSWAQHLVALSTREHPTSSLLRRDVRIDAVLNMKHAIHRAIQSAGRPVRLRILALSSW